MTGKVILVVCACIATLAVVVFVVHYFHRQGVVIFGRNRKKCRHFYYYPEDIKNPALPNWEVTERIPLTPDQAVIAAIDYLRKKQPGTQSWEVDNIQLEKGWRKFWIYSVILKPRPVGTFEIVKVLLGRCVQLAPGS